MAFVPGFHCRFGGTDWFADQVVCPGRLLVLSDGLGLAIGAMGIFTPHGSTGIRPFASAEDPEHRHSGRSGRSPRKRVVLKHQRRWPLGKFFHLLAEH